MTVEPLVLIVQLPAWKLLFPLSIEVILAEISPLLWCSESTCALFPLTVTVICTRSFAPTPWRVTVAFAPGALKFNATVPDGTLSSVNCP